MSAGIKPYPYFGAGLENIPMMNEQAVPTSFVSALKSYGASTPEGSGVASVTTPGVVGSVGAGAGTGASGAFGLNIPTANLALGGLSTLANIFMGMQAMGQAKDQFDFTRRTTQANLENQTKSYNTNMEDKLTARAAWNGQGRDYVDDYMSKHSLATPNVMGKR